MIDAVRKEKHSREYQCIYCDDGDVGIVSEEQRE